MAFRIEEDFLGEVEVPAAAYYGIFTVRASKNFQISGMRPSRDFIRMLALVKKSAAEANAKTGSLDRKIADAIAKAAVEVAGGKFDSEFILDSFTAGAGTPFNMNMNEVIANRALELIGKKKGEYGAIHPNNHVNMSQSSNDIIPAAVRLALIYQSEGVLSEAKKLSSEIAKKAKEFSGIVKAGRTHLMDAVPLTVGDELSAHCSQLDCDVKQIEAAVEGLLEQNIGATALGTGINTHPDYQKTAVAQIAKNTGMKVREGKSLFRLTSYANDFLAYSSSLRSLSVTLNKLSNDLKLLSSGPNTAIGEYLLPEVEPGSSIMPGKVNPSVPECMEMVANKAIGNDTSVMLACLQGQLQLNVQTPLILQSLSESSRILANGMKMLREECISGLKIDKARVQKNLEATLISVTALAPYFGYAKMSEIVKKAQKQGIGIRDAVLKEGLLDEKQYDSLMSNERLTRPSRKVRLE